MNIRLGIDLGGTSAKLALVNQDNKIVRETSLPTGNRYTPYTLVDQLYSHAKNLMRGKSIKSIGVGVAGDIDYSRGIIRVSPNLRWKNIPFKKIMQKKFKRRVCVDNDANVAAWGLFCTQTSRRVSHMIVLTLGTGVGGGVIIDGKIHRGATGSAGEIGHMMVKKDGFQCNCGNKGCLEAYAGGFYISRRARQHLKQGKKSSLQTLYRENPLNITPLAIDRAARRGDAFARSVWSEVGTYLGIGIGNLIYVLNPQVVVLSGGVSQAKDLILNPLRKELRKKSIRTPFDAVDIRVAKNASHGGVIGASLLT